ncbi:MAG: alpha amylase C-terminal domain-containing protein, partial [Phormidesmis sp.]
HSHYRGGTPQKGDYREIFNSDAREFGGANIGNLGGRR